MRYTINIRAAERQDCEAIYDLIVDLAIFEKASTEVSLTLEELDEDIFGSNAILQVLLAEANGSIAGAALFYEKYSTWKGRGLHLEDLIVKQAHRGKGIGSILFQELIDLCKSRNYQRMEWQVLDWNKQAIEFYQKYGTEVMKDWLTCRLSAGQLAQL